MIEIEEYRNPTKTPYNILNKEGYIDVEINHPTYGWIPFTLNENDTGSDIDVKKLYSKILKENTL